MVSQLWSFKNVYLYIYLREFFFWLRHAACEILVPRPGIKPVPPALGARSVNHWAAREVPISENFKQYSALSLCLMSRIQLHTMSTQSSRPISCSNPRFNAPGCHYWCLCFLSNTFLSLSVAQIKLFKNENVTFVVILDLKTIQKMFNFVLILKGD